MIKCDVFKIEAELITKKNSPVLKYRYWTDLPCGTLVGLSCNRYYKNYLGTECVWTLYDEELIIQPNELGDFNGGHGEININNGDANASKEFENDMTNFSHGIKGYLDSNVNLELNIGARQRIKAFGKNNNNLDGVMVSNSGEISFILETISIAAPVNPKFNPLIESK